MYKEASREILTLIEKSPSPFHAVRTLAELFLHAGYEELAECDAWALKKGGKYFTTRNGSSIIAFAIGGELADYHSSSPPPTATLPPSASRRRRS